MVRRATDYEHGVRSFVTRHRMSNWPPTGVGLLGRTIRGTPLGGAGERAVFNASCIALDNVIREETGRGGFVRLVPERATSAS